MTESTEYGKITGGRTIGTPKTLNDMKAEKTRRVTYGRQKRRIKKG